MYKIYSITFFAGTNSSTRMVFRLSDSRQPASSSSSMQLISISVLGTSVEQQFNESESLSTQVMLSQRDGGSCAYQYISDVFQVIAVKENLTFLRPKG